MPGDDAQTPVEHVLEVDRADFVARLGVVAKLDGVGRMPITLRFDGQELVLSYGCIVRMKATGVWPEEARFSKAALKQLIKNYRDPGLAFSGHKRATVNRFVRGLGGSNTTLHLVRQDDKTLLIDGHPIPCSWSTAAET